MLEYREEDLKRVKEVALDVFKAFIRICEKYELDYFVHWGTALGTVRHQGFIPWDDDIDVGMLRKDYDRFLEVAPKEIGEDYVLSSAFLKENCFGLYTMMSAAGTLHVTEQESLWGYRHGIRIDIFPFDKVSENKERRAKQIAGVRFWNKLYVMKSLKRPNLPGNSISARLQRGICRVVYECFRPIPASFFLKRAEKHALSCKEETNLVSLLYDIDGEKWKLTLDDIYPLGEGTFEGVKVKMLHHNHEALTEAYGDYMTLPPESERVNHYSGRLEFNENKH